MVRDEPYYRDALARIHHEGFGFHADACAPGILALLEPVAAGDGLVVEVGCGSGLLTRHLVDAGHRVIATDASPAMLDIARSYVPDALDPRQVVHPQDPQPEAHAHVSPRPPHPFYHVVGVCRWGPGPPNLLIISGCWWCGGGG